MGAKDEKYLTGTTKTGFSFSIDKRVFDDFEMLDCLSDIQDDDGLAASRMVSRMFNKEQKKALYDHVRDEDGYVPAEKVMAEVADIMNAMKDTKDGKN